MAAIVPVVRHSDAWHIPAADGTDFGVLVRCGTPEHPYWWLLCPASATLCLGDDDDLNGCSDALCLWDDVHAGATALRQTLTGGAS